MTSSAPNRTKVFISYSHKDAKYLEGLLPHLNYYALNKLLDYWVDTKIKPGANWHDEIVKALASAKVAILLISIDFLVSQFIVNNELPPLLAAAENEGLTILTVILRPCALPRSLSQFQAINSPSNPLAKMKGYQREELWVKVTNAIMDALNPQTPAITQTIDSTPNSYFPASYPSIILDPFFQIIAVNQATQKMLNSLAKNYSVEPVEPVGMSFFELISSPPIRLPIEALGEWTESTLRTLQLLKYVRQLHLRQHPEDEDQYYEKIAYLKENLHWFANLDDRSQQYAVHFPEIIYEPFYASYTHYLSSPQSDIYSPMTIDSWVQLPVYQVSNTIHITFVPHDEMSRNLLEQLTTI